MFVRIFLALCRVSPNFRKWCWRRWYEYLARAYGTADWTFMNYGYAFADGFKVPLEPQDEADRYCIQLYHYVVQGGDLEGRRVLEVGSGRGGGAEYLCRTFKPRQLTGMDYSPEAVERSKARFSLASLDFLNGDAEAIPLEAGSVEIVVNVESSHCYGSVDAFLAEVRRVLQPGGLLLLADLRHKGEVELLRQQLEQSGLTLKECEDITPGILRSMALDDARKRDWIGRLVPRRLLNPFQEFAGVKDSRVERAMGSGDVVYQRFVLEKPVC